VLSLPLSLHPYLSPHFSLPLSINLPHHLSLSLTKNSLLLTQFFSLSRPSLL
jgi:hypothetical protein